jgi:hypothetical protein
MVGAILTLFKKSFCRQRRAMWPFDSGSACASACVVAARLTNLDLIAGGDLPVDAARFAQPALAGLPK